MKKIVFTFFAIAIFFSGSFIGYGQTGPNELWVPQLPAFSYLEDVVMGDTLPNGQRKDSLRVYVLQRGATYLVRTNIRNSGWPLRMKARDSAAARPAIYLVRNTVTSSNPGRFVEVRGNVSIKNLTLIGIFEPDTSQWTYANGALLTQTSPGWDIIVDDCILTNTSGNHIRTDNAPRLVKVTNTIFANMGYLGTSNLGAGKALDLRAGSCDSLIMVNNTFVNYQDRVIRHYASTANINYMLFDHNTLVNGMSYHGMLSLGRVGKKIVITNNLLVDAFALGNDSDAVRQAEFTDGGELDRFGFPRMTWVISNPNDTTSWAISNNYYTISTAGKSFFDSASIYPIVANPPLTAGSPLTYHINRRLGADSATAFINVTLALTNTPKLMTKMMQWYRRPLGPDPGAGAGKTKVTTHFNRGYDFDRKPFKYFQDTLRCTYPTSSSAYIGAQGGFPVGDLNWFPGKKAEWELWMLNVNESDGLPAIFTLHQNYPNPFNPSTKITYTLNKSSKLKLEVFDLLGRKVATLVDDWKHAGEYAISFDGSGLASGIYMMKLSSRDQTVSKKMMIIK